MFNRGEIGDVTEIGNSAGVHSLLWTIPRFTSLSKRVDDYYESPYFRACDVVWFFQIYPNGMNQDSAGWVDLSLYRCHGRPPQTVRVTVGVKTAKGVESMKEISQEFSNNDNACCWYRFCSRSQLEQRKSRWMPGDAMTLACDVRRVLPSLRKDSSTQTVAAKEDEEHQSSEKREAEKPQQGVSKCGEDSDAKLKERSMEELAESFHGLLSEGEDSDVLLKVRGKEFPAHRAVLRARSPVFRAMFTHDMLERVSGAVTMEDCDPDTFPDFLEHVYTGSIEMVSSGNVFSLYEAADKYDLPTLRRACSKFASLNPSVASFCEAIAMAVRHDDDSLTERATEFFCGNALEIVKMVEWQKFLIENPTIGNELYIKQLTK